MGVLEFPENQKLLLDDASFQGLGLARMKLYIWNHPFYTLNGATIAYAVANSEEEARAEIAKSNVMLYGETPSSVEPSVLKLDRAPDRILSLPCAEIFEWAD